MAYSKNTETDVAMRVIEAVYVTEVLYEIPKDWDLKEVTIKYGELYYKGVIQVDVKNVELDTCMKYPSDIKEHDDGLEYLFDE